MASGVREANEAQRQRPEVQGHCPGRDSEPDKVIFNVYYTTAKKKRPNQLGYLVGIWL